MNTFDKSLTPRCRSPPVNCVWMRSVRQNGNTQVSWCFYVKRRFLSLNETKNQKHLDCGRSILATQGGKTIPDSTDPRLELCYLPFVAGIDLGHQGIVDSYKKE